MITGYVLYWVLVLALIGTSLWAFWTAYDYYNRGLASLASCLIPVVIGLIALAVGVSMSLDAVLGNVVW